MTCMHVVEVCQSVSRFHFLLDVEKKKKVGKASLSISTKPRLHSDCYSKALK